VIRKIVELGPGTGVTDLHARVQTALGVGYRVEKELGGGGMSRVFLAEEVRLGRRVVVKVLPPELSAGVSAERFEREISVAANLQHPHIVPLLTAGSADDLVYYIMPFIDGESLRAKIAREGELPVDEALRIMRDVTDALAYAHRHHLVHRDIKPENVLLSEGHALVADFGVAKAVTASSEDATLTSVGVALGTPLYMSPEQAAADPHIDHRADIYALGALAYEMLSGVPPFTGRSTQAVLAAHLTQAPDALTKHRASVPESLNQVILRCLEKKPADRWQNAGEVLSQIETILTPTRGTHRVGEPVGISSDVLAATDRAHPLRVAGLFGLAALVTLAIVYAAVRALGLPDWVLTVGVALLVVGLPIVLVTGHHERKRALTASRERMTVPAPMEPRPLFTWRNVRWAGGVAFAGLGLVAAAYMIMRVFGIGPVGTLVARGDVRQRDPLVVADFDNSTSDSALAASVTEALRVDLSQSSTIALLDREAVVSVLQRMGRDAAGELKAATAREVAEREGAKAFVAGEVAPLGAGFILSLRVMSTSSGATLVALRETATDQNQIIGAVDRLSARLRERLGESLKTIRSSQPLDQVTTGSIDALRRYSRASQVFMRGNYTDAIPFLEQALEADSTFAMAYRKLSVVYFITGTQRARQVWAARKAFDYRHRLTPVERLLAEGLYYDRVEIDRQKAIDAYKSVLEDLDPRNVTALVNLAGIYNQTRRYREAEQLAVLAMRVGGGAASIYAHAAYAQVAQGKFAAAETTLTRFSANLPATPHLLSSRATVAGAKRDFARAALYYDSLLRSRPAPNWRVVAQNGLADLALTRGRLADAERWRQEAMTTNEARGAPDGYLAGALYLAAGDLRHRNDPGAALRRIESALARHPLSSIPAIDRPYVSLAGLYAAAGRVADARRMLTAYNESVDNGLRRADAARYGAAGAIALAEGRTEDALTAFRTLAAEGTGPFPGIVELAESFDRAGRVDSAIVHYERFVAAHDRFAATLLVVNDAVAHAALVTGPCYRRLGELHERRGDRDKAIDYYTRFVELWNDADPELQPQVRDVRSRLVTLARNR